MNPEPARMHFGPYQVVSRLGKGGMGEVYRAHDALLGRDVAIKTLPREYASEPEWGARFRREARMLAALNHPNIAVIHGVDETDGVHYLVMELVEGETLADRIARSGALPLDEALKIGRQVADALEAAHRKSITHRDIKPANIIVSPDGRVKVLDFGLAKPAVTLRSGQGTLIENATRTGAIVGTPGYMSPEQLRGAAVDQRTDIWAFGCLLYELLTGQPAFYGETLPDTLAAVVGGAPKANLLPPATPERVRSLLRRCLQKDPAKRVPSMTEVSAIIDEVLAGRRGVSRRALAAALGAGVVAAAVLPLALSTGLRERLLGNGAERIRTIAVLPLANLSGKPDQEYFSDGMTESLINELAKVGALKVISRTSVMTYKGSKKPLRQIAKALGADAVLEGTAQRAGDRIRISAQLVDGKTDRQLWANSYDRNFADVLTLQREVAETVARQVGARLTAQERFRLAPTRAVNTQAHEAYLRGLFYLNRGSPADFDRAQQYFELALKHDPNYALADAALSLVWTFRQQYNITPPQDAGPQAVAAAERAIALDPNLPEAHYALAVVKGATLWDWSGAEKEFVRAIQLNPSYADARALYSHLLNTLRRPAEARAQIERAVQLDPKDAFIRGAYAVDLFWFGQYDEALAAIKQKNALNPNLGFGNQILVGAPLAKGQHEQAVQALIALMTKNGHDEIAAAARRGDTHGGYREAFLEAAKAAEAYARNGRTSPMVVAWLYVYAGRMDLALTWYQRALNAHNPNIAYIRLSMLPEKAPESDPAFQAILKRLGIP